jgi:hypothetical protein
VANAESISERRCPLAQLQEQRFRDPNIAIGVCPQHGRGDGDELRVDHRLRRGGQDERFDVQRHRSQKRAAVAVPDGQRAPVGRADVDPDQTVHHQLDVPLALADPVQGPPRRCGAPACSGQQRGHDLRR